MAEYSLNWQIVCLEVDEESIEVGDFLRDIWPARVSRIRVKQELDVDLEIVGRNYLRDLLREFECQKSRIFTVYGSGKYHHFTHGILETLADERSQNYTYVHIDQHTDNFSIYDVSRNGEILTCANFVSRIPINTKAIAVKYVGCKKQLNGVRQADLAETSDLEDNNLELKLERLLRNTPFDAYVSIDLDVLKWTQMTTGWTKGNMDVCTLLSAIKYLNAHKNILSADALGLSRKVIEANCSHIKPTDNVWKASFYVYAMIAGTLFWEDIVEFEKEHKRLTSFK